VDLCITLHLELKIKDTQKGYITKIQQARIISQNNGMDLPNLQNDSLMLIF